MEKKFFQMSFSVVLAFVFLTVLFFGISFLNLAKLSAYEAQAAPEMLNKSVTIFPTEQITQTTRHCVDSRQFTTFDLQWIIVQGSASSTATLTKFHTNDFVNFNTGIALTATAVATGVTASNLAAQSTLGNGFCIQAANTITTTPYTLTVIGLGK